MKFFVAFALCLAFLSAVFAGELQVHSDQTQTEADASCNIQHNDLTTSDPPQLLVAESGFLTADTLTLTLSVSKRYLTATVNASSAVGDFCSDSFSVVSVEGQCSVKLQAQIAWSDHALCGIYLDTAGSASGNHLVFRGSLLLNLLETNLPAIRDRELSRNIHSVFPFLIRFPKTVSTSNNITAYFPVTLEAAIIRQFDVRTAAADSNAQSLIRLFTSVQYPFKLTNPTWISNSRSADFTPNGVVGTTDYLLSGESCNDDSTDVICEQEWKIEFNAQSPGTNNVCTFSGTYVLGFTVVCEPGADAHCPLPQVSGGAHQAAAQVQMIITTEDFCPKMFTDVPASASLASYQDAALLIPKTDFLQNDDAYFLAISSSDKATISATEVSTVTIDYTPLTPANSPVHHSLIYDSSVSNTGPVTIYTPTATRATFSVHLGSSTFPVDLDSSLPFTFTVVLKLTFLNTAQEYIHIQHRVLADASGTSSHPIDASVAVSIGGATSPVINNPSSSNTMATNTLIYIIAGSCVGVILFATIAVVVRRRLTAKKSSPSASTEMTGASAATSGATTIV